LTEQYFANARVVLHITVTMKKQEQNFEYVNPLKYSGVRQLHLKVFNVIQV